MIYALFTRYLFDPLAWDFYLMLGAVAAGYWGRPVLKDRLFAAAAVLLGCLMFLPLSEWLARPLENSYPRPPLPVHVDGIVVLDAAIGDRVFASRRVLADTESLPRMLAGADLARRFPAAKLVYSGTSAGTPGRRAVERAALDVAFQGMGLPPGRVIYEDKSLDTGQNLAFSRKLLGPRPGETWMLVTSAVHMPRAMAIARKLGWAMVPWPSNYISQRSGLGFHLGYPSGGLLDIDRALHEWIGLAAYRLTGRASG